MLRGSAAGALPVFVDSCEVGRALRNLVVNAIRHTPADQYVEVLAYQEPGTALVQVSDTCGGIPAEHLPRVFDVAFRGETARTPGPGEGAGLGLSIARGIIEAHSGHIAVRNAGRWPPVPDPAAARRRRQHAAKARRLTGCRLAAAT